MQKQKKQKTKTKKTKKLWLSCVVFKFLSKKIINLEDRNWKQTGAQHSIWSSKSRAFHIFPRRQVFYYSYASKTILNKMSPNYGYFGFHIDFHWSLGERKQKSSSLENISILIHHNVQPLSAGGLSLQPNFQKGGLDRTSSFRGGWWERGGDFFQGGCKFHIKSKLKSEIFNDKKSL